MENIENKRGSLLSNKSQEAQSITEEELPPPPDKFGFVRITVLLLGLTTLLTGTFFTSSYDYWMYKFRDPAMGPVYNASNRTTLQINFSSGQAVAMAVPALIGLAFGVTLAQKFKSRPKVYICYGVVVFVYSLTTICVKINTDNWQIGFFVLTFVLMGIKSLVFTTLMTTVLVVVPKLPPAFLKWFMYGQGTAGIFSVILQIICLAVTNDSESTGLIYFTSGTLLFVLTAVVYYFSQYTPLFQRYVNDEKETPKMTFPKWIEIKTAFFMIWPVLLIQALVILGGATTTFINLIVSESYGDGSDWTQKYFVPVITIFYGDVIGMIGRICSSANLTKRSAKWHIMITALRVAIFTPLFIFCNVRTKGREVDPWFPHDWQYMIILGVFVFTNGYFGTTCVTSIQNFVKKGEPMDIYYLLLTVILSTCGFAFAPISVIIVNAL